jgi:RNA polymerase sigma-70 factor (ECF subfamily)
MELDTLYREVLVLRFHEELSLDEIAKVTRAPLSTVKSRLYRGLAAIKPKLDRDRLRRQAPVVWPEMKGEVLRPV